VPIGLLVKSISLTRAISTLTLVLTAVAPLHAQTSEGGPDPAKVRVRMGPLWMNPTVSLTNLGIDDNIFNEPEDRSPKRDVTFTVTPTTDLWVQMGRTWVSGSIKEELVWYQKYATERAANSSYKLGWKVPLNLLVADVGGSYLNARDRPGYEIDARALRTEVAYKGVVEVRALSKTFLGVRAEHQQIDFDKTAVFLGTSLQSELNHVTTSAGVTVRHQLTPLTSVSFAASRSQDRFEFSPLRDSDSDTAAVTLAFDPFALIKGGATFGYRDFQPRSAGVDDYKGLTAAVDLSYSLLGMTKFSVRAIRDVQYSFDVNQPYYLQTGVDGSIAQQIFGPFDVVGRLGVQSLAYRDRAGTTVLVADRVDSVRTYGAGVGYHLGKDLRLGFNVDKSRRISDVPSRRYSGFRFGTAVTYGL
jgi:hypothetical protein